MIRIFELNFQYFFFGRRWISPDKATQLGLELAIALSAKHPLSQPCPDGIYEEF